MRVTAAPTFAESQSYGYTPEGLAESLRAATEEGIPANTERWQRFRGHHGPFELQILQPPFGNKFAHASDTAALAKLIEEADRTKPPGVFHLINNIKPAVATRAAVGRWHPQTGKGAGTSDADIASRCAAYVDIDALDGTGGHRPTGTAATDEQVARAVAVAERVHRRLSDALDGDEPIGIGFSGNGAAVMLALDHLEETDELKAKIKELLAVLQALFGDAHAEIDAAPIDARRLCPAWGSMKRKGAPDIPAFPHRRTGFICAEQVRRLSMSDLVDLVWTLRQDLSEEQAARVDKAMGVKQSAPKAKSTAAPRDSRSTDSVFAQANACDVSEVLRRLGKLDGDQPTCPGCGLSDGTTVAIVGNGLKCLHGRCSSKGVSGFFTPVDLVAEANGCSPIEAVRWLGEAFGFEVAPARNDSENRPEIIVSVELAEMVDLAERAIAADPDVYQRGGRLVRVVLTDSPLRKLRMQEPAPRIDTLPRASLRERLASCAKFVSIEKKKDGTAERRHVLPPPTVVETLDARGTWGPVRHLEAVVDSPILRPDGTILDAPGYDQSTGLLYRPNASFLQVPRHPTKGDALKAKEDLFEAVVDFDFAGDLHKAAWFAALLTPLARFAYDGPTPLTLIDSNLRGVGKGLMVDTIAITATGRCAPVTPLPVDDAEMAKTISSVLLAGIPIVSFDNVGTDLGGPALDLLLTSRTYSARILGKSEMTGELPVYTLLIATGNNVMVRADTGRRTLRVRLESKYERPEDRQGFKHPDLRAWLLAERPRLVRAALTILRAYCLAGRPADGLRAWGSFEQWSALVRGAVTWVGCKDPGETRLELAEEADTEAHGLRRLLEALDLANLARGFTTSQALHRAYGDALDPVANALREAIEDLCPTQPGRTPSSKSLGRRLLHLRRRVIRGRMLDRFGETRDGAAQWRVQATEQSTEVE